MHCCFGVNVLFDRIKAGLKFCRSAPVCNDQKPPLRVSIPESYFASVQTTYYTNQPLSPTTKNQQEHRRKLLLIELANDAHLCSESPLYSFRQKKKEGLFLCLTCDKVCSDPSKGLYLTAISEVSAAEETREKPDED